MTHDRPQTTIESIFGKPQHKVWPYARKDGWRMGKGFAISPEKYVELLKFIDTVESDTWHRGYEDAKNADLSRSQPTEFQPISNAPENRRVLIFGKMPAGHDEMAMAWLDRLDRRWYFSPQGGLIPFVPELWCEVPLAMSDQPQTTDMDDNRLVSPWRLRPYRLNVYGNSDDRLVVSIDLTPDQAEALASAMMFSSDDEAVGMGEHPIDPGSYVTMEAK